MQLDPGNRSPVAGSGSQWLPRQLGRQCCLSEVSWSLSDRAPAVKPGRGNWKPETISLPLQNPLSLVRKFFAYDKNYLLEEAQLLMQDKLLDALVEKVKDHYFALHNPLGLDDKLSVDIDRYRLRNRMPLNDFYQNFAGIYRYKFGQNQLEFLWDGCDHIEKYKNDWAAFFEESTDRFCMNGLFIQAVLDLTVFLPENRNANLSENRMNHFMLQHFDVRIHKQRGIVKMKVA